MAKSIRSIKNTLCADETLGECTIHARFLFVGLITQADDHGRFRSHAALVRGQVFPYDDLTVADVEAWIQELAQRGRITLYEVDGQRYGHIARWAKNQRVDNASQSELPPPPGTTDDPPAATRGELRRESGPPDKPRGRSRKPKTVPNEPEPARDDDPAYAQLRPPPLSAANCGEPPLEGIGEEGIENTPSSPPHHAPPSTEESERRDTLKALADACGIDLDRTPRQSRRRYQRLAGELVELGAARSDIAARAAHARATWRDGKVTPDALVRRWAELEPPLATVHPLGPGDTPTQRWQCPTCHAGGMPHSLEQCPLYDGQELA